jgi:hypothetical protein
MHVFNVCMHVFNICMHVSMNVCRVLILCGKCHLSLSAMYVCVWLEVSYVNTINELTVGGTQ